MINHSINRNLIGPISKKEIKMDLASMDLDKAPRLDSFTARFLKNCWKTIKNDLHKMVIKSQACNKIGEVLTLPFLR